MVGLLPYFPRLSFIFKALEKGDIPVFRSLQYDKKWHINRIVIPGSNGLINLSIPIVGGRNSKSRFDELMIDNRYQWQREHHRTFVSVYGRSPFFNYYEPELKKLMERRFASLWEWNACCLEWVLIKLRMDNTLKIHYFDGLPHEFNLKEIQQHGDKSRIQEILKSSFRYQQVFEDKIGFIQDLSIVDLLFNMGPDARQKIMTEMVKL